MDVEGDAIGVLVEPVVDVKATTAVPEGVLARPLAGAFDGAPKMGEFWAGAFHEYSAGYWLDMMNGWVMTNKVMLRYSSTSRTGRRRCGFGVHEIHRERANRNVGKKGNGDRHREQVCGAATMQE